MAKAPGKLFGLFRGRQAKKVESWDPDQVIRKELAKQGDDGASPRDTTFWFFGGDLQGLEQAARASGFKSKRMLESDGVILSKDLAVDEASFRPIAEQMNAWADDFGCEYDGWETAVSGKLN